MALLGITSFIIAVSQISVLLYAFLIALLYTNHTQYYDMCFDFLKRKIDEILVIQTTNGRKQVLASSYKYNASRKHVALYTVVKQISSLTLKADMNRCILYKSVVI